MEFNPIFTKPGLLEHFEKEHHFEDLSFFKPVPYPNLCEYHAREHEIYGTLNHNHNDNATERKHMTKTKAGLLTIVVLAILALVAWLISRGD